MRLTLASLKVHLAHCAAHPGIGHAIGLTFTATGVPGITAVPHAH